MSLQRPLTSSTQSLLKFASSLATTTARSNPSKASSICFRCQIQQASRRKLSTATEYRPHSLDPAPPPPRNTNIPDTSIAGVAPEIDNRGSSRQTGQHESASTSNHSEKQSISISENEAQKTKPVTNPASTTASEKPKRPTKLRPRKAAMTLTPAATTQLRNLLSLPEPKFIRVGVKNRGCSGLAYHLEYVDKAGKFDEAVEHDGVKVLIDSKALFSIIGSEMDWVEDKLNQRFVFRNPNISKYLILGLSTGSCTKKSQRNNVDAENHLWSSIAFQQHVSSVPAALEIWHYGSQAMFNEEPSPRHPSPIRPHPYTKPVAVNLKKPLAHNPNTQPSPQTPSNSP